MSSGATEIRPPIMPDGSEARGSAWRGLDGVAVRLGPLRKCPVDHPRDRRPKMDGEPFEPFGPLGRALQGGDAFAGRGFPLRRVRTVRGRLPRHAWLPPKGPR